MNRSFVKMHGLGNDFVIIDARRESFTRTPAILLAIANRRRGIGCDQTIFMEKPRSPGTDIYLDMYNADGSTLRACGNATRCVARLLFEETGKTQVIIETVAGLLPTSKAESGMITADMGPARLEWSEIPLTHSVDTLHVPLALGPLTDPCCVNMGNPHAVFFVPDAKAIALSELGPKLEHDALFLDRCNIEIVQILSPDSMRMRVWERGTGITQACGSGACAALVAAARRGLSKRRATVIMDGGPAIIEWREDNHVLLTGPVSTAFHGSLDDELFSGQQVHIP